MIRVTVQIENEEDETRATVISASFDNFDEIIDSKFIEKARPFDNDDEESKKESTKKKSQIGFGPAKPVELEEREL